MNHNEGNQSTEVDRSPLTFTDLKRWLGLLVLLISAALLHNPEILVFDEPLSGLDVTSALVFRNLVKSLARDGKIILYSSHVLEVVVSEHVVGVHGGRTAEACIESQPRCGWE